MSWKNIWVNKIGGIKMKKSLSVILVAVMITMSLSGYQKKSVLAAAVEDVGIDISNYTPTKGETWEEDNIWYSIYDDHAEVNSYRGTDGNMEIKPYVQGKPVTAISNWHDIYDYDDSWWGISEESIDSDYKVKRLVIPHTVKHLKIANSRNGDQHSLFERSNTLEELVIEDGAELSISSVYEDNPRKLNLIDTGDRMGYLGNLKSVYIGSDVKEFSKYLLCGSSMAEIKVSENNPYYSSEDNILFNHDKTELIISGSANPLKEYTISTTVEKIGVGFEGCRNLSKIVLGDNVKTIKNPAAFNTGSDSLEIIVPYGSYAEAYVKELKADYIRYTVTGAPEQTETTSPTPDSSGKDNEVPEQSSTPPTAAPSDSPDGENAENNLSGNDPSSTSSGSVQEENNTENKGTLDGTQHQTDMKKKENPGTAVKPGQVRSLKAKNKKRKIVTLTWKKAAGAKKYQIQYSQSKKFKKAKTKTTGKTSYKVKKLKKKKTYYFRVRAVAVNGRKGTWSKKVKVKIKK